MNTAQEWARAYGKQAKADMDAYNVLSLVAQLPLSQSLHFLQMACEKLCKSHLCGKNTDPAQLQSSHVGIAKVLPDIIRQQYLFAYGKPPKATAVIFKQIKNLAREIELLAPAVQDGGRRPNNCEYPWENTAGVLQVPASYEFPNLSLLHARSDVLLLKLVTIAIERLNAD